MADFLKKIGDALDALNGSTAWEYLKSVLNKIVALLGYYKEDEAATVIDLIGKN